MTPWTTGLENKEKLILMSKILLQQRELFKIKKYNFVLCNNCTLQENPCSH